MNGPKNIPFLKKSMLAGVMAFAALDANALNIVANFDPAGSVTSAEQTAFNYAAQQYESLFSNNMTVTIDVNGNLSGPNTLGKSSWFYYTGSYSTISTAINTRYGAQVLPAASPAPSGSTYALTAADDKALGLTTNTNSTEVDGTFSFNGSLSYTTDPNNQTVSGKYDFIGVAEHEISEILGRVSGLTQTNPFLAPMDLVRYTAPGVNSFSSSATGVYFSLNGGATNLQGFNSTAGGDLQDWNGSNLADAYNAFLSSGQALSISSADIAALQYLGYKVAEPVPLPATAWLFASACLGMGAFGRRRNQSH